MRSDRRTIAVLCVVILCGLIIAPFRSSILMGFRALLGQATLSGLSMVSTSDESNPTNLGAWSLPEPTSIKSENRDVQVGFIISKMLRNWNNQASLGKEAIAPLEDYVRAHPDDLKAKAHLLRFSLSINNLEQVRDKALLGAQAERMAILAHQAGESDPSNWYWREREIHFLTVLNRTSEAEKVFSKSPFPTMFDDFVDDEVRCKEALYESTYIDFPSGCIFPIWAGTIYPHYAALFQIDQIAQKSKNPIPIRVAEIHAGMAMVRSCPTSISAFAGSRLVRAGLWMARKPSLEWKKLENLSEENTVKDAFIQSASESEWNHALKVARSDITRQYLMENEVSKQFYFTQYGPILLGAGILTSFLALPVFMLVRSKIKSISKPWIAWSILFAMLLLGAACWSRWGYLINVSLASNMLLLPYILLALWALIATIRKEEKSDRLLGVLLVLAALVAGCMVEQLRAGSFLFLAIYSIQRRNPKLSPWTTAAALFVISFHMIENLALARGDLAVIAGFILSVSPVLCLTARPVEPDQPRWSTLAIGLVAVLIGSFVTTQYNRGMEMSMADEMKKTETMRTELARL